MHMAPIGIIVQTEPQAMADVWALVRQCAYRSHGCMRRRHPGRFRTLGPERGAHIRPLQMFADGYGTGDSCNEKPVQQMRLAGEKQEPCLVSELEPRRLARSKHCRCGNPAHAKLDREAGYIC